MTPLLRNNVCGWTGRCDTWMLPVQALKARLDKCSLEQCKAVALYISSKTFIVVARHQDISTALQMWLFESPVGKLESLVH